MWWKKRPTRKELEEDAKEDLELKKEDAEKVAGGSMIGDKLGPGAAGVIWK